MQLIRNSRRKWSVVNTAPDLKSTNSVFYPKKVNGIFGSLNQIFESKNWINNDSQNSWRDFRDFSVPFSEWQVASFKIQKYLKVLETFIAVRFKFSWDIQDFSYSFSAIGIL